MFRLAGQALWVYEEGGSLLDPHTPWALNTLFEQLKDGRLSFSYDIDLLAGEIIKVEAYIGPPPCKEPYLTYTKWYQTRLQKVQHRPESLQCLNAVVRFQRTDGNEAVFMFDICAELVEAQDEGGPTELTRILWIDVQRSINHGPATTLASLF